MHSKQQKLNFKGIRTRHKEAHNSGVEKLEKQIEQMKSKQQGK